MLIYILKSVACLAILLLFYKLLLEKESMHIFKRFFLLGALLFALIVPNLVFTEYVVVEPAPLYEIGQPTISDEIYVGVPQALEKDVLDVEPILWAIYFLGIFFFGIKFIRNLFQIFLRIRRNPKYKKSRFVRVLLQEKIPPHTFFKYIFLNQSKFESKEIPKEVILHEETHARQKHSLDVVFIELLQVIFWINPLIYFFKKAIKLNHEFLADSAVLNAAVDAVTYQNTLLSFLSSESAKKYQPTLPNAINYSSIKKRFTVMKSRTSKKSIVLRSALLLPLMAVLIVGFSESRIEETVRPEPQMDLSIQENSSGLQESTEKDKHYEKATFKFRDQNKKVIATKKYYDLTEFEKSILMDPIPSPTINVPSTKQLNDWKDGSKFGIWIDDKRINNKELSNYSNEDFKMFFESKLEKNAINYGKHYFQVNLYTKNGFEKVSKNLQQPLGEGVIIYLTKDKRTNKEIEGQGSATKAQLQEYNALAKKYYELPTNRFLPLDAKSELKRLEHIYSIMSDKQKADAEPYFIVPKMTDSSAPSKSQDGATKEQVAEYNALAESYNTMLANDGNIRIMKSDVDRLEYLYGLMSEEQKANAEPFPDFPEPPPPPEVIEEEMIEMEREMVRREAEMEMALQERAMERQERETEKREIEMERQSIQIPPPPPPPHAVPKNRENYSDNLLKAYDEYIEKGEEYGKASEIYSKNGTGSIKDLRRQYVKVMKLYDRYVELAVKENLMQPQKPRAPRIRKGAKAPKPQKVKKGQKSTIPPPAPAPKSPLDHAIEMAKQGATFYYKKKKISSDEAIDILKNNRDLSMDIKKTNNEPPIVKIDTHF